MSTVDNPWVAENWNLTEQGNFVRKYGIIKAQAAAKEAGTTLGALKPLGPSRDTRVFVYTKRLVGGGSGGGGLVGAGSSGTGPPP